MDEFRILCDEPVRMQQAIVARPGLIYDDWEQIAEALPDRGNRPMRSDYYPYVLQIPVMGLEETMMYPALWLYVFGAVNASRENIHIRANVLEIFLTTKRQHTILAIIGELTSLFIGVWPCPIDYDKLLNHHFMDAAQD